MDKPTHETAEEQDAAEPLAGAVNPMRGRMRRGDVVPARELGHVHLIGIGGAGLSAIARLLHAGGVQVSGSDAHDSPLLHALAGEGIDASAGHDAHRLEGIDTVIVSSAVHEDNAELREARRRDLRIWPRSAGLQSILMDKYAVAIAGTHGKTTTATMLTTALVHAGMDPSYAIGAQVPMFGGNARLAGDVFVVEADESDGSFLEYTPGGAIVTNIDPDHLDTWGTEESYRRGFDEFIGNVDEFVVLCADDPGVRELNLSDTDDRVIWAGFGPGAQVQGRNLHVESNRTSFDVYWHGNEIATVRLQVVGAHYALDALLAMAAGLRLGAGAQRLADGLALHQGASRRMERIGSAGSVTVYDSYAHHPTEIAADLAAARAIAGERRVLVAFQPHLVSRTRRHAREMGRHLLAADIALLADIYLAREEADPDVSSQLIADAAGTDRVQAVGDLDAVLDTVSSLVRPGDVVITMGAGDITTLGPDLLAILDDGGHGRPV